MQKTKGTVEGVNQKQGSYGIVIDSEWYNGFDSCPVKKGDEVELEYTLNGKFKNIKNIEITKKHEESNDGNKSKTASVMISYAKDLAVAGVIEVKDIDKYSRSFLNLHKQLLEPEIEDFAGAKVVQNEKTE